MGTSYDRLRERLQESEAENAELRQAIAKSLEAGNQLPIGADVIARLIRGEAPEVRKALDAERDGLLSNDALTERLRKNREKAVEDSGGDTGNRNLYSPAETMGLLNHVPPRQARRSLFGSLTGGGR